jgi:hypothetical protein
MRQPVGWPLLRCLCATVYNTDVTCVRAIITPTTLGKRRQQRKKGRRRRVLRQSLSQEFGLLQYWHDRLSLDVKHRLRRAMQRLLALEHRLRASVQIEYGVLHLNAT